MPLTLDPECPHPDLQVGGYKVIWERAASGLPRSKGSTRLHSPFVSGMYLIDESSDQDVMVLGLPKTTKVPSTSQESAYKRASFHRTDQEVERRFKELATQWISETMFTSSWHDMVLNDSYMKIIGLGPQVLPLLLRELRDAPANWFWALRAVAGEDPSEPGTTFDIARRTWLTWGEQRGLL